AYSGNDHSQEMERFRLLYQNLAHKNSAACYGIYSKNQELLASAAFLFSHKRAYYLLVGNHPNGRTLGASHALLDHFIREHAGRDLLLDFEGSDIRNLAFFYSSFGAQEEKYAAIKRNRLPWYIKWLKE
ncbi:MAG: GNAT family N-acetyltransferase, partial [Flavisolibacter sp.]